MFTTAMNFTPFIYLLNMLFSVRGSKFTFDYYVVHYAHFNLNMNALRFSRK